MKRLLKEIAYHLDIIIIFAFCIIVLFSLLGIIAYDDYLDHKYQHTIQKIEYNNKVIE